MITNFMIKRCQVIIVNMMFSWSIFSTTILTFTFRFWIRMQIFINIYCFSMFMSLFFIIRIVIFTWIWLVLFGRRILWWVVRRFTIIICAIPILCVLGCRIYPLIYWVNLLFLKLSSLLDDVLGIFCRRLGLPDVK